MQNNNKLRTAKTAKNDEFYTLMEDIEKELRFYTESFEGKVVYCNCDDYRQSNFYKYFYYNFHYLKLKKLICTGYKADGNGLYAIYDGKIELNGKLNGDGDFRSEECIEYLKECDVVVTNPPFSLFRQYVKQLMDYGKKFIIIGNNNAITYKEIFPYIKDNKMWLGINSNKTMEFIIPMSYEKWDRIEGNRKYCKGPAISWFTNVPYVYERKPLILTKSYYVNPSAYPKFDNFDAINVDKVADIPMDYDGVMGVPITFLKNYYPNQFSIIGLGISNSGLSCGVEPYKKRWRDYRINVQKRVAVDGDLYMVINQEVKVPYARILIKKKDDLTPIPAQFEIIGLDRYVEDNPHYGHRFTIKGEETYARILIKKVN